MHTEPSQFTSFSSGFSSSLGVRAHLEVLREELARLVLLTANHVLELAFGTGAERRPQRLGIERVAKRRDLRAEVFVHGHDGFAGGTELHQLAATGAETRTVLFYV